MSICDDADTVPAAVTPVNPLPSPTNEPVNEPTNPCDAVILPVNSC